MFGYGSLIFRVDNESSISPSGTVRACVQATGPSCFTESNVLIAPFNTVSFTRYKWFNAVVTGGALALAAYPVDGRPCPQ